MADEVRIDITTQGDPKGAEKVSKSLGKLEKQTKKNTKASKDLDDVQKRFQGKFAKARADLDKLREANARYEQGLSGKLFPTFRKGAKSIEASRKQLEQFGGPLGELVNPANIAGAAVAGAIGAITAAVIKLKSTMDDIRERIATPMGEVAGKIGDLTPKFEEAAGAAQQLAEASKNINEATAAGIETISARLEAADQLAEAETNLSLALIDQAEARGNMSAEEAEMARLRAQQQSDADAYTRALEAQNEILAERRKAVAEVRRELERIQKIEREAQAAATAFAAASTREKAAQAAPGVQANQDFARREAQQAGRVIGEVQGSTGRNVAAGTIRGSRGLAAVASPLAFVVNFVRSLRDQEKTLNELSKRQDEAIEEFKKQADARADAIKGFSSNLQQEAVNAGAARSAAQGSFSTANQNLQQQASRAAALAGGAQAFSINQQAEQISAGVPSELVGSVLEQNRDLASEVAKLKAQVDDIKTQSP